MVGIHRFGRESFVSKGSRLPARMRAVPVLMVRQVLKGVVVVVAAEVGPAPQR